MSGDTHDHDITPRPNPMVWTGEEEASGVFIGGGEDAHLLDLPIGFTKRTRALRYDTPMGPAAREVLEAVRAALDSQASAGLDAAPIVIPTDHLSADDCAMVVEALGDGEVAGVAATADGLIQIAESTLAGVWRIGDGEGTLVAIEVGSIPRAVREGAAAAHERIDPPQPPEGLMNAPALLAEIAARASRPAGARNHVINFTLLPLSDADAVYLPQALGQGAVSLTSGGYGAARVRTTSVRNVWAVQYLNGMGAVVLDTLEIGGPPDAILAGPEDFEDSRHRLGAILEAYAQ